MFTRCNNCVVRALIILRYVWDHKNGELVFIATNLKTIIYYGQLNERLDTESLKRVRVAND